MPIQGYSLIRRVAMGTDWRQKAYPVTRVQINPQIAQLLEKPSWSVQSLLPPNESDKFDASNSEVTREKLYHLLKLSALPPPATKAEEERMLKTLQSQIHFVKEVQKIDTKDVEPLVAIRDETKEAIDENTVTLEKLQPWLDLEERVGRNGTVRRVTKPRDSRKKTLDWDPFVMGPEKERRQMGKYFFVKKEKTSRQAAKDKT